MEDVCEGVDVDVSPASRDEGGSSSSSSASSPSSSPPRPTSWTDDEFESHLRCVLSAHPLSSRYPEVLIDAAPRSAAKWRRRYRGNPTLWRRLYDEERVVKELIEAAPVLDSVRRLVAVASTSTSTTSAPASREGGKYTVVDLACGRGYLSMTLSECLPPERVGRFDLVDRGWPMHGTAPGPRHISWAHIYGTRPDDPPSSCGCALRGMEVPDEDGGGGGGGGEGGSDVVCRSAVVGEGEGDDGAAPPGPPAASGKSYYETWPIPLNTAKVDLKKSKEIRDMERRLLGGGGGPIILVAVHLCGTLSLRAVELFNNNPRVRFFCLKPCCLPGMVHAKRDEIFRLGGHTFDSKLVCMSGKWNKNVWRGPHRNATKACFERWVENLYLGINDADDDDGDDDVGTTAISKVRKTIEVQIDGGYQNEFLFAERSPKTVGLWDELQRP